MANVDPAAEETVRFRVLSAAGIHLGKANEPVLAPANAVPTHAPVDVLRAFGVIDDTLWQDNATGALATHDKVVVLFPGRARLAPPVFGPFKQDGVIDGCVVRVGGKNDTEPAVYLREGGVTHTHIYTTPEIARRIARHMYGPFCGLAETARGIEPVMGVGS